MGISFVEMEKIDDTNKESDERISPMGFFELSEIQKIVYKLLAKKGSLTNSQMQQDTGKNKGVVYEAAEGLIKKGLVGIYKQGPPRTYVALEPYGFIAEGHKAKNKHTAEFIEISEIYSNSQINKDKNFEVFIEAYEIGNVPLLPTYDIHDYYDVLEIKLEYKDESKEWTVPLFFIPIEEIVRIEPVEEPIEIPEEIEESEEEIVGEERGEERIIYICSGCLLDNKCYPFGFRKDGNFCSDINDQFTPQSVEETICENSFECQSNLCIDSQCIEQGLFTKIINWFKNLFRIN